jgi:hypothetical protein
MPSESDWSNLLEMRPELQTLLLVLAGGMGLALCVLGRRLVRTLGTFCGIICGAAGAYALTRSVAGEQMLLIWVAVGAFGGLLLGWCLFRVWMGLALALVLTLAGLIGTVLLQGNLPPLAAETRQLVNDLYAQPLPDDAKSVEKLLAADHLARQRKVRDDQLKSLDAWWKLTDAKQRWIMFGAAAAGGLIGLVVGLGTPHFTAILISALCGAVMLVASVGLLNIPAISVLVRGSPTRFGTAVGLITAAGTLLQWTIFRRKTDR